MTTQDKLTPEILTAAGYKKLFNGSYIKEIDNAKMEIIFNNIGELSIYYSSLIKLKALSGITVGKFNTLLDIVKLNKFKIK
jgi:hypothetical protein